MRKCEMSNVKCENENEDIHNNALVSDTAVGSM
jgi:hypothetical protein